MVDTMRVDSAGPEGSCGLVIAVRVVRVGNVGVGVPVVHDTGAGFRGRGCHRGCCWTAWSGFGPSRDQGCIWGTGREGHGRPSGLAGFREPGTARRAAGLGPPETRVRVVLFGLGFRV